MRFRIPLFLLAVVTIVAAACDDYDKWTASPDARLTLSTDTLAWDTLISTIPSNTKTLTVHNRNSSGLRIARVWLGGGAASAFRVNVDGESLYQGQGENFEVRGKDSIMVRVECTLPRTGQVEPQTVSDQLHFTLESGIEQSVTLTADAQDAYFIRGLVLSTDSVFETDMPYVVYDSLCVDNGVCLTLPAGATLMFHHGARLDVAGTLLAEGEIAKPVTFRGDRTDRMFPNLTYDNTPGRWEGIRFRSSSMDNRLCNCRIRSGNYGIICDSIANLDSLQLSLTNTIVHNIAGPGLKLSNTSTYVTNCQISNTLGRTVDILGGDHLFVHTTIAQFYPYAYPIGDALFLANQDDEGNFHELRMAHFYNCVITGYGNDVIMGNIIEGQDYLCNYRFQNCYLNTPAVDEERYIDIVWDDKKQPLRHEKNFPGIDVENYQYEFMPDSTSTIRHMADPVWSSVCPNDILGNSRFNDSIPDAGCYQFIPKEQ